MGGWVQCDSPFASTNWIRFDGCNLSESFVKVLLHPVSLVAEGISLLSRVGRVGYLRVLAGAILAHERDSFSQRIDCLFKLLDLIVFPS